MEWGFGDIVVVKKMSSNIKQELTNDPLLCLHLDLTSAYMQSSAMKEKDQPDLETLGFSSFTVIDKSLKHLKFTISPLLLHTLRSDMPLRRVCFSAMRRRMTSPT